MDLPEPQLWFVIDKMRGELCSPRILSITNQSCGSGRSILSGAEGQCRCQRRWHHTSTASGKVPDLPTPWTAENFGEKNTPRSPGLRVPGVSFRVYFSCRLEAWMCPGHSFDALCRYVLVHMQPDHLSVLP